VNVLRHFYVRWPGALPVSVNQVRHRALTASALVTPLSLLGLYSCESATQHPTTCDNLHHSITTSAQPVTTTPAMSDINTPALVPRASKRKAIEATSAAQAPKRQKPAMRKAFRFLDLPTELRLQVYGEVTEDKDPAVEPQALLRVCKLINGEVSGDLPKFVTKYLKELENTPNKAPTVVFFDTRLETGGANLEGFIIRVQGPATNNDIDNLTISLPISVYTKSWSQCANPLCRFFRKALFVNALGVLLRMRRKQLTFSFFDDTNSPNLQKLHPESTLLSCLDIEWVRKHRERTTAVKVVFDWGHPRCAEMELEDLRVAYNELRRVHREVLEVGPTLVEWPARKTSLETEDNNLF
jgi:hypothetical protein